jgi:hypothetical protein
MGMCLYIKSSSELELARLARDPDRLLALAMPGGGSGLAAAARELSGGALSPEALDRQVDMMQQALRAQGWRGRVMGWLMARQLRHEHAKMRKQFERMANATDGAGATRGDQPPLDLHKSWHVLHYLFTGSDWQGRAPASTLLTGGRETGEDLGYGPARIVSAVDTSAFARFLEELSVDELERRIDLAAMSQLNIYGVSDGSDDTDRDELIEELEHYFPRLQSYVADAASRSHGMAIWMM